LFRSSNTGSSDKLNTDRSIRYVYCVNKVARVLDTDHTMVNPDGKLDALRLKKAPDFIGYFEDNIKIGMLSNDKLQECMHAPKQQWIYEIHQNDSGGFSNML